MRYYFLLFAFIGCFANSVFGQYYDVATDDFESVSGWTFEDGDTNHFVIGTCAGNYFPTTGTNALYVAPLTGINDGCNVGSQTSYDYAPAPTSNGGVDTAIAYRNIIHQTCGEDLAVSFYYKFATNNVNDNARIVYRVNSTDPWTVLGASIQTTATSWQNGSYNLPATLNGQDFQLGFMFVVDNAPVQGIPLAIDNFVVKGLDHTNPTISGCPTTHSLYADSSCSVLLPNLLNLVNTLGHDNCTADGDLTYSMSPNMGETVANNTAITFTVHDASGNTASCSTTITLIDTIKPVVTCNQFHNLTNNANDCQYLVPDLTGDVISTADGCTSSGFIYTQSPAQGTTASGIVNATVYVEDNAGNVGQCIVRILPKDTIAPTVICPADKVVSNGANCSYTLGNYVAEATATDNCTLLSLVQNPASGTIVSAGNNPVTMVATDELGNQSVCTFTVKVVENQVPVVTNCPSDITSCDSLVTYSAITGTDNCVFGVYQVDNTGLKSGDYFPVGTTHLQYEIRDSSGNVATCNFDVTILASPEQPQLVQDTIQLCNETSTPIAAIPSQNGNGFWSLPNGSSVTIADVSQPSTTVSNLASGTNIITWNIPSQNCGTNTKDLVIINSPSPDPAHIQLDTTYSCASSNVLLNADTPLNGVGVWSTNDGANIVNPVNHTAIANQLNSGWNTFYYTVSSGICPSTTDSLKVFRVATPTILSVKDTTLCQKADLSLVGSVPPAGVSVLWYFEKGQGTFSDETQTSTTLTSYQRGENIIIYAYENPQCGARSDTMKLTFGCGEGNQEFFIPTMITPNQDGKNDYFEIAGLNDNYPNCKVTIINRWGDVVFKEDGYEKPWDGTRKGKALPIGTYYYIIQLNDGSNAKPLTGPISIVR